MPESQDAIALLKQDHRTVEELFAQFEKASGEGRKQKLAEQICLELSVHAAEEEEKRLEGMFSQARKAGLDMDALGQQLAQRKAELIESFKATGVPKPELTTMDATPA
jgi:hypothetical protein